MKLVHTVGIVAVVAVAGCTRPPSVDVVDVKVGVKLLSHKDQVGVFPCVRINRVQQKYCTVAPHTEFEVIAAKDDGTVLALTIRNHPQSSTSYYNVYSGAYAIIPKSVAALFRDEYLAHEGTLLQRNAEEQKEQELLDWASSVVRDTEAKKK